METTLDEAHQLQNGLAARATGGDFANLDYLQIRSSLMNDSSTESLVPDFVRRCKNIDQFWAWIKDEKPTYAERRKIIWDSFSPLIEEIETLSKPTKETSDIFATPDFFGTTDWRLTNAPSVQKAISDVSLKLILLLELVNTSNTLGSENSVINDIQKAQLIALLETALAALNAPAIQTSAASGLFSWLTKILKRGLEKGTENGVSDAMGDVIDSGKDLFSELAQQPGISDLDKLL
ncbi:hypothetical protein A9Q96_01935 [Rhodobacterales bacterium 52_120_T64]|nr:hypothetical protein A9Q96_01935 [Rhodobacterales bacterium 52_120_T64]